MRCLMHILVTGAVLLTVSKLEGVKSTPTASETLHIFHDADQKARPPKTDDFGDLLPEGAVARIGTTRFRHGHDIRSLAISKDGTIIASGGQDRDTSARVWDAKTGKQLLAVDNQGGFVALSPDGQTLVVSGKSMIPSDAPLRVWNVKSGKELPSIIIKGNVGKPVHGTRAVAFSPKGDMLAVVTWFQDVGDAPLPVSTIRLLNVGTGQEIGDLSAAERVAAFAFSPDGRTLAVIGGNEHYLQLWETGTGKLRAKLTKVFGEHCVFDPAGKTVAVGNSEAIVLVDLETQKEGRALTGFSTKNHYGPGALAFSPDGKYIAASGAEYNDPIRIWDTSNSKIIREITRPMASEGPLVFSPDGKVLIAAIGPTIRQWSVATGHEIALTDGLRLPLPCVAYSPDGKSLAVANRRSKVVQVYDIATRKETKRFEEEWATSVAFTLDGKHLVTWGNNLTLWEVATARRIRTFEGHTKIVSGVALAADGQTLISGGGDGTLRLWEIATGKQIDRRDPIKVEIKKAMQQVMQPVTAVAAVGNTKNIAVMYGGTVSLWNTENKKATGSYSAYPRNDISMPMAVSPDGRWLACEVGTNFFDTVALYDLTGAKPTQRLGKREGDTMPHGGLSFAFSPNSKILATASADKSVRLWDVATGKELHRFLGHIDRVSSVTFAPDGKTLASASWDGTVLIWDVAVFMR